jgi:SAM-dependent methyltransferase
MKNRPGPAVHRRVERQRSSSPLGIESGDSPARRLFRSLLSWRASDSPVASAASGAPEDAPSNEDPFASHQPFVAGTGILGGLVPPIASAPLRRLAGHESIVDYLVTSDTWHSLACRFVKERSTLLEIGCGCGDVARMLIDHPNVSRYIGLDQHAANIEWCAAAIRARAPERFDFHCFGSVRAEGDGGHGGVQNRSILDAPDAAVDLIIARSLFGQLDVEELKSLLEEVGRILCLNGLFLAAVPGFEKGHPTNGDSPLAGPISPDHFQQFAEEAGLQVFQRMGLLEQQVLFIFTRQSSKSRSISDEMLRLNRLAALEQDVHSSVHADDFIYWFCATHPHLSLARGIHYYFQDGGTSARKLANLISGFDDIDLNSVKLMEFASGYGCVTRHLKKHPNYELISCDIHPQALEFLCRTLGVRTLASSHHPSEFAAPEKYDVIFALSFFSHMPRRTFGPWLKALFQALHDPGYLVFTTLGLKACKEFGIKPEDIPADGLWFEARSEQHDLDEAEYGMTVVTPDFVRAEVERQTGAPIVVYQHVGWWDNQDLWVIKRDN